MIISESRSEPTVFERRHRHGGARWVGKVLQRSWSSLFLHCMNATVGSKKRPKLKFRSGR